MKKLILIALLSLSPALACNDNMVFYGNKIGCELKNKENYTVMESYGDIFYRSSNGKVNYDVSTKNGIIHTMRAERRNATTVEVNAHYLMFTQDYGLPLEHDDKFFWFPDSDKKNTIAMFMKGNVLVVLYGKAN